MAGVDLTINRLVNNRLSFLTVDYDLLVEDFGIEMMYLLQNVLGKTEDTDAEVEDETNYSVRERGLIADLVSCFMIMRRVFENVEGDGTTGGGSGGSKYVKKSKAGDVEVEFALPTASEATNLQLQADALLSGLKNSACLKASQIGFTLCVCDDCSLEISSGDPGGLDKAFFVYIPEC